MIFGTYCVALVIAELDITVRFGETATLRGGFIMSFQAFANNAANGSADKPLRMTVLITDYRKTNFSEVWATNKQGDSRKLYENDVPEADEVVETLPIFAVDMREVTEVDGKVTIGTDSGSGFFVPKFRKNGEANFKNMIENPGLERIHGVDGAVAKIDYYECKSEHDTGRLKVGDIYNKIVFIGYSGENKAVQMQQAAKAGFTFKL